MLKMFRLMKMKSFTMPKRRPKNVVPLVLIDLQPAFLDDENPIIGAVISEIRSAKKKGQPIIVVELEGYGRTYGCVMDLLWGYERKIVVSKQHRDGSSSIIDALEKMGVQNCSSMVICGVYLDQCVYETAASISNKGFSVSIVAEATTEDPYSIDVIIWDRVGVSIIRRGRRETSGVSSLIKSEGEMIC